MKARLIPFLALAVGILSSCGSSRSGTASNYEVDDVYYSSADRKAEEAARADRVAQDRVADYSDYGSDGGYTDNYESAKADKYQMNGDSPRYNRDNSDDDFYYSRMIRRFDRPCNWNYYDPYYSYDVYYNINTPYWGYYQNRPWWYDPWYYNGPSWTWTYGWGYSGISITYGYGNYWGCPNYYGYGWGNSYGYGWGNPYGYGGGYGYGYGGYWNGYNNGYYNGYGNGYWDGSSGLYSGNYGHRGSPMTQNTTHRPGNQPPAGAQHPVRTYQATPGSGFQGHLAPTARPAGSGKDPVQTSPGRNVSQPTYTTRPGQDRPTQVRPSNDRPAQVRPNNDRPREVQPSRNNTPRTTTPRTTTPRTSTPRSTTPRSSTPRSTSPSRSSTPRSSGGNVGGSSSRSSSGSTRSSGGGRRPR